MKNDINSERLDKAVKNFSASASKLTKEINKLNIAFIDFSKSADKLIDNDLEKRLG